MELAQDSMKNVIDLGTYFHILIGAKTCMTNEVNQLVQLGIGHVSLLKQLCVDGVSDEISC